MKLKKILITGASGAVGFEVLSQLKASNSLNGVSALMSNKKKNWKMMKSFDNQLKVYYGDITDPETVKAAVKDQDVVIHMAALIPTRENKNKKLIHQVNVVGTENIVQAMESECSDAFLIYTSSVAVYGDRIKSPMIRVDDPFQGLDHDYYAKTKVEAESLVKNSKLNWTIFRLTAIMGVSNHKFSPMAFEVPLETSMEIATLKDTANGLILASDKTEKLNRQIFNFAGGKQCRILYGDFLKRAYKAFGLGKVDFREYAFAKQNFHCGFFEDSDKLEDILHFRTDTIDSYFERFKNAVPSIKRFLTRPFSRLIKWYLSTHSEPLQAYKNNDKKKIEFFFGMLQ